MPVYRKFPDFRKFCKKFFRKFCPVQRNRKVFSRKFWSRPISDFQEILTIVTGMASLGLGFGLGIKIVWYSTRIPRFSVRIILHICIFEFFICICKITCKPMGNFGKKLNLCKRVLPPCTCLAFGGFQIKLGHRCNMGTTICCRGEQSHLKSSYKIG